MSSAEFNLIMARLDQLEELITGQVKERKQAAVEPVVLTSFRKRCQESQARSLQNKERREARTSGGKQS